VEAVYEKALQSERAQIVRTLQPAVGTLDQRGAETVEIADLQALPSSECFLFEWLRPFGFTSAQILQIADSLDAPSGKLFSTATHVLYIDRSELMVAPVFQSPSPLKMPEDGVYRYQEKTAFRITFSNNVEISKSDNCITIDKEKVEFPLTVRVIQSGDRFTPFGMNGSKLVSDYLTDKKVSLWAKRSQLVVTDAHDHILWLVGHRIDHHFRITPATTTALRIELLS
jgi:tRNA(Ile)-lysidine synthase